MQKGSVKAPNSRPRRDVLKNQLNFPSFFDLPDENDLSLEYYRESSLGLFRRCRTWYFLGEITLDEHEAAPLPFLRRRIVVKDRKDEDDIPIFFYPETGSFDYETLKKGWTVAVMCAEQHHFRDLTVGLRIEDLDWIHVIKCGLSNILAISTQYVKGEGSCWGCDKKHDTQELKKCSACKEATYCNKECQSKDWKDRHKKWCKALPDVVKLASVKFNKPERLAYWQ